MPNAAPISVAAEVSTSIATGRPVVALETAVLTHGLPRESWETLSKRWPRLGPAPEWLDSSAPLNVAAMRAMIDAVRRGGAVPAVTAVVKGIACVGVDEPALTELAASTSVRKLAQRDLAPAIAARESGGTTVSAAITLAHGAGIDVFATGGIGGVHRDWQRHPDVSADLAALSRVPICVVSSGAKSILDLPATIEALETLSIPVVGFRCDAFPRFVCEPDASMPVPRRSDDEREIAQTARIHWSLGGGALLVVRPVEAESALRSDASEAAQRSAEDAGVARGAGATPELLERVAEATEGGSLRANVLLLRGNAALAAGIAAALRAT